MNTTLSTRNLILRSTMILLGEESMEAISAVQKMIA